MKRNRTALTFSPCLAAMLLAACTQTGKEGAPAPLSAEGRPYVQTMASEAQEVVRLLNERADIRARTPEAVQLRLDWQERLFDARILLEPEKHGTWISDRQASATALSRELESRAGIDATRATLDMAQYATAEAAYIHAKDSGDKKAASSARIDMSSAAAHATLDLAQIDDIHPRSFAWETLLTKWDWRAATGALETALPEMNPDSIADEWIDKARRERDGMALGSADRGFPPFVQEFNAARTESLKAAMHRDDKAVVNAGNTMKSAAQTAIDVMDRQGPDFFATPENLATYLDWSHKLMESDWLVNRATDAKVKALDAHAARVKALDGKVAVSDALGRHELAYSAAEAEYLRTTLK